MQSTPLNPVSVTTPTTTDVTQQQAPRIVGNIHKLFATLRSAPNQESSLRNIVEFVAANEKEISEKRTVYSSFAALLTECERTMLEMNLDAGCEVYIIVTNMTLADGYGRRQRTVSSMWSCVRNPLILDLLKGSSVEGAIASQKLIALTMHLVSSSPIPLTSPLTSTLEVLDKITSDCVSWLSSSQQDGARRLFACNLLIALISRESASVRSLKHVRELTVPLLWDISLCSLATGMRELAIRVAHLCALLASMILDSMSAAAEELEHLIVDSFTETAKEATKEAAKDAFKPMCAYLMMSEVIVRGVWTKQQHFVDACQKALVRCEWVHPTYNGLAGSSSTIVPDDVHYNHCYFVAAAALIGLSKAFQVDIDGLFSKLLNAIVPIERSDRVNVSIEDRGCAAKVLGETISHWSSPSRLEALYARLLPVYGNATKQFRGSLDTPLLQVVSAMAKQSADTLPMIQNLLMSVGNNNAVALCIELEDKAMLLNVTKHLLIAIRAISEAAVLQVGIHAAPLLSFEPSAPKEVLVESLAIMATCNYTQRLEHAMHLLRHEDTAVRAAAVTACITICAAHTKATSSAQNSMRLDNTVTMMVERLLDVAIIDMSADIRRHVLKGLDKVFDPYLSMPDNIATIFLAYHDSDLSCSEESLELLCRLLPVHPAHIHQGLSKLQDELFKEIEERNPVGVTLAAARRLNLMMERGTILLSCKQIERVLIDKLNPQGIAGPSTHPLFVELLRLLCNSIEAPSTQHEDLNPICKLAVTIAKEGPSNQIRVAAFGVIRAVMRTKAGVPKNDQLQSQQDVYQLLEEVINDNVTQMDATRKEAMSALGAFGAVNPVTMRTLRKSATDDVNVAIPLTDSTGLIKPLARTHPLLEDTYPSVALYLLVKSMQGADADKQEAAYSCILDMLRETSVAHKQQLIGNFMPLLRRALSETESSPLHAYILEILVDLSPLLRNSEGAIEGSKLMHCLSRYCSTPDAASPPLSSLIVTLLDELAKALPAAEMLSHRWSIDFILARLNNDMDDPDLILRVIQALESFANFMKDKDLRHVVPQVLQCLCSPPLDKVLAPSPKQDSTSSPPASINSLATRHDPNSSGLSFMQKIKQTSSANASLVGLSRMINGSCLEFINQIVLKHNVLARDLCALIVHRIMEFVQNKTDATICDLAMGTLVSLLAAVDKSGKRFIEPIVRMGSKISAVSSSDHFATVCRAHQSAGHSIADQKVKLPAVADKTELGQGEFLFKIVCDVPQMTKGAFVQEMWSIRIAPQHVLVLNIQHNGKQSTVDFKFAPNPEADRNAKEFLKATRNTISSLHRNLKIIDVQQQRQGIGAENASFLKFTTSFTTKGSRKIEARWLEWLHNLCNAMLECSPHSALRAMVPVAKLDRELSVAAFPFAVTSVLSNLQESHREDMMRNLNAILPICPFDVKRVIFDLAEFMEGQRLTQYVTPKEVRCIVRRPNADAKFGINYDQDKLITVTRLAPGGPGELARVPVGAALVSINGEGVRNVSDIPQMIRGKCEIELVLTPIGDSRAHRPSHYLDIPTMARVGHDYQLHAKAIYFNEQVFDRIVGGMKTPLVSIGSPNHGPGSSSGALASPSDILQPCVESLIATYQHLGLTMEAKGLVSFISDKVSENVFPERFNFEQAATLEQLNWWQEARRLYEAKMESDVTSLLGAVRCWDALGDLGKLVAGVDRMAHNLPQDILLTLQGHRGNAALVLGEWAVLDEVGANEVFFEKLEVIPKVAVLFRQNKLLEASAAISKAREDLFERLTDGFSEGYVRAYDLLVEAQHLNHLSEVISYPSQSDEKRAIMRAVWSTRLLQMAPKPQHWRASIAINSLVLAPEDDLSARLETALLCSKSQQRSLAEHILLQLLHSKDIDLPSNWNEQNPQILAAYAQHLFQVANSEEGRRVVYDNLANVLNVTGVPAAGHPMTEGWASCWLQLGEWSPQFTTNHEITLKQLHTSSALNPKNAKAFHYLGRAHQALAATVGSDVAEREHVAEAITALFRAVQLSGTRKTNLQSILRIISMWFSYGDDASVNEAMNNGILATDISVWLGVIPQLLARMEISSHRIRESLGTLLSRVGVSFPQALIYPLTVSKKKASVVKKALEGINQVNPELVDMASQISNELVRIAILWNEKWDDAIRRAAKTPTDFNEIVHVLQSLYSDLEHPATPNEVQFAQTHRQTLAAAWGALQRKEDGPAWSYLKKVYTHLNKASEKRLYLREVSPILAEMSSSVVAVPGTFHPTKPIVSIASFQQKVIVMSSKQKPRRFGLIGSDGITYRFLLKGHEDLRQDERAMQLIELVNSFFQNDATSIEHGYAIPWYAVIPLTENVGIMGWVENTETIFRMLEQRRQDHNIDIYLEINMIMNAGRLANIEQYRTQPKEQRVQLLKHVSSNCPSNELALIIWERNETCEGWIDYRKLYAQTFALMSMVGYVLGLGDRHLNNLMLQHGGNLVHIDFGDCFEVAMQRQSLAETVPFRLTRLMIRALGVTGVDGAYRITCENVMKLLRRNRESLITILETFLYDPLIDWCGEVEDEPPKTAPEEAISLSCSLSTRKNLLSSALLTDEWAVLSEHIRQGGGRARAAAPLPAGHEKVPMSDAIDKVRAAVRAQDFPLANGWMQHIQRLAPDLCVQSVFEQSVREKRSLAANKALSRVQAKLNGTDFSEAPPAAQSTTSHSPVRSSIILDQIDKKSLLRNISPGDFDTTTWGGAYAVAGTGDAIATTKSLPVQQQVDRLIYEATSYTNLADAYIAGWAPFW